MSKVTDGIKKDLLAVPRNIKEKVKEAGAKKLVLSCVPYVIFGYVFNRLSWLCRHECGENVFQKALYALNEMGKAFHNPLPSLNRMDFLVGIVSGCVFFLIVHCRKK